jgi:opacity protein-like surface antigen
MDRRLRRPAARAALLAAVAATLSSAALAVAYVTTDLTPWNLTQTLSTYGGGTQFHIATGTDGWVAFRWLDSPTKLTVVSGNACSDWSLIGQNQTIGVGDTGYHSLFQGFTGQCFVLRGRTGAGEGSMSGKNGRVRR